MRSQPAGSRDAASSLVSTPAVQYSRSTSATPYQRRFMDAQTKWTIVEAATKTGKTTACWIWLLEQILAADNRLGWWVAPTIPQARMVFDIIRRSLNSGLPTAYWQANETKLEIRLANGGALAFKSGEDPDNLYGFGVHAAVCDEATRCRPGIQAVLSSVTHKTEGLIKVIGNVQGSQNWAYQLARLAESGASPFHTHFKITCWDAVEAGIMTRDSVELARATMRAEAFAELFECVPSGMSNPFGVAHIASQTAPLSQGEPVVWGWDIAKQRDWTVGIGLDRQGYVCRFHRWQHEDWMVSARRVKEFSGSLPTLVDATGIGDVFIDLLRREGGDTFEGFVFNPRTKQDLMEGLAIDIQRGTLFFPDGPIVDELKSFQYELRTDKDGRVTGTTYAARPGAHDDCVCSLALAAKHWRDHVGMATIESVGLRNILAAYEQDEDRSSFLRPTPFLADPRDW